MCVGLLMFWLVVMQADSQMSKDRQVFYDASLQYVFKIQEVQERKKFEFVEPVSLLILGSIIRFLIGCIYEVILKHRNTNTL